MDILVTAIITGVCVALGSVLYMKYGKKKVAGGHNETHPPKIIDTLTAALKSLSCEYEVNEKETSIFFIFQDEHFIAYNQPKRRQPVHNHSRHVVAPGAA